MRESGVESQVACSQMYRTQRSWQQNNVVYENTKSREVWLIMPVLGRCQNWLADKWLNDSSPAGQSDCTKLKLTYLIQGLPQQLSHCRGKHGKVISTTSSSSSLACASSSFNGRSDFKEHYTNHPLCKTIELFLFFNSRIKVFLGDSFYIFAILLTRIVKKSKRKHCLS